MLVDLKSKKVENFLIKGHPKLLRLAVAINGVPHVSSVWYIWDRKYFWISTAKDRLKVVAIKKNPAVALIIDTDEPPYHGVIVEGNAPLVRSRIDNVTYAIVKRYVPKKEIKREFEALMRAPRILIRIKAQRTMDIMSYKEH